jgi:hypothetical protein
MLDQTAQLLEVFETLLKSIFRELAEWKFVLIVACAVG